MSYHREPPPPSVNGWGRTIDREVASIRRELDQMQGSAADKERRIRRLEDSSSLQLRDLGLLSSEQEDLSGRLASLERALRAIVWVLAVVAHKIAPDVAATLLALLPVRI